MIESPLPPNIVKTRDDLMQRLMKEPASEAFVATYSALLFILADVVRLAPPKVSLLALVEADKSVVMLRAWITQQREKLEQKGTPA